MDFEIEETKEYLRNNDAPPEIVEYAEIISTVTNQNPRLISALIQYLKDINWGKDSSDVFEALLEKKFGNRVLQDAQRSIKELIIDSESKELLYRLSLINWTFNNNQISAVSEVPITIRHPNEKITDLENIWIQKISETKYQISPLINEIGKNNLSNDVQKNVYISVAHSIRKEGRVDQIRAFRIISLFLRAEEFDQAGFVLINLYQSAQTPEEIQILKDWGFLLYWSNTSFPEGMSLFIRAYILQEQVRLKSIIGADSLSSFKKLEAILEEDGITKGEEFVIRMMCLSGYHYQITPNFIEHVDKILSELDHLEEPYNELLNKDLAEGLLWILLQKIHTELELKIWFELIKKVEIKFKTDFFENEIAQTAITILISRIQNTSDFEIEEGSSNETILKELAIYFKERNNEILESTVLKRIVAILFQVERGQAIQLTQESLQRFSLNISKYLLNENLGKLFFDADEKEESKIWLETAIGFHCTSQSTYIDTLIYYASVISTEDPKLAVEKCHQATQLLNQREEFDKLDFIQINAELGLAYWINNENLKAFLVFELVVDHLFELRIEYNDDEKWIRIFKWVAHALGYISSDVRGLEPPQKTKDDTEYIKPYQGFITFNTKSLKDLYRKNEDPFLLVHMAYFAEGVERIKDAYKWSQKAFDLSRRVKDTKVFFMVTSICSQFSLLNFRVSETIESVLLFSAITSHLKGVSAEEKQRELEGVNISEILEDKPSDKWNVAEDSTITFAVIPLFIMLLSYQIDKEEGWEDRRKTFVDAIRNYIPDASNKLDWEIILEIVSRVLVKDISIRELTDRSNTFGEQGKQNLQIVCTLGIIYLSKNDGEIAKQLLNITPYLTKTQSIRESSIRYILHPFIQKTVKKSIKNAFVGNKVELDEILDEVNGINRREKNCIQLMLQLLIKALEIKVLGNRRNWLYDFEEI